MARLRSPRTDDPFQLSFGLSRYRQCCAACPHATQHSRSDAIVKLCMRHYTSNDFAGFVVDLAVERGEACRQGRDCIVVAAARGDLVDEPVKAGLPLAVQGLRD